MKRLLLAALILVAAAAQAQTPRSGAVTGQIMDSATSDMMEGAFIEFRSVADTTFIRRGKSMPDGKFTIQNLPYGEYTIEVSFLGYENYYNKLTVNTRNMTVAPFYMVQSSLVLEGIEVVRPMIRVSMHGDTIIYNPAAFDVPEDADAEAILKQLPGVEVKDGTVTVQGKNVEKILVDGKETYGTDVNETMKTIPANMLQSIEAYEKQSDFAEATGINDGDEYMVMNFVTGIKFGHYGDVSGMYGLEDMYDARVRWNLATGGHMFRITGAADNIGTVGYGGGSSGMFGGGGYGSATARRGLSANNKVRNLTSGLSYNYEASEDFRINTSYRYGHSDSERKSWSETKYFNDRLFYDQTYSNSLYGSDNDRHNIEASGRWKIDKRNTLNMRLIGSISNGSSTRSNDQTYYDMIEDVAKLVQSWEGSGNSSSESYNIQAQVNYSVRMGNRGRTLGIGLNGSASNNDGDGFTNGHTMLDIPNRPLIDSLGRSRSLNENRNHSMEWRAKYFEPLSPYLHLTLDLRGNYSYDDSENRSEQWAASDHTPGSPLFDIGRWEEWGTGSGVMNQRDSRHHILPGLNYSKNNNHLRFDVGYSYLTVKGESILPQQWKDKRNFGALEANFEFRKQITPQKRVSFQSGYDFRAPSLDQLQGIDIMSSSSGLSYRGGNPDLKVNDWIWSMVEFSNFNLRNSSSLSVWLQGSVDFNDIGTDKHIVTPEEGTWLSPNGTLLKAGEEYSRPMNTDTSWSFFAGTSYGRPLKFIKSNFNTSLVANYGENQGLVNGEKNTARTQQYRWNVSLNSNFSEDLTLGLSYLIAPQWTDNTHKDYSDYDGLTNTASFDFYWLTWKNFFVRANASYINQSGSALNRRYENLMASASIGKKLFKNRQGEITIGVNDIFDQTNYDSYSYDVDHITYSNDRGIGRYYSLSFRYRLRNFSRDEKSWGRGEGRSRRRDR